VLLGIDIAPDLQQTALRLPAAESVAGTRTDIRGCHSQQRWTFSHETTTGMSLEGPMSDTWKCVLLAGFGGTLPTVSKFGSSLVTETAPLWPTAGFYVGVAIYFLIGAILCYALEERTLKQALFAGIAAPAIITSGIAGANSSAERAKVSQPIVVGLSTPADATTPLMQLLHGLVPSAHAQQSVDSHVFVKPATAPGLPQGFKYSISAVPEGASDWRTGTSEWEVSFTKKTGATVKYKIPAGTSNFVVDSKEPITALQFTAKDFESEPIQVKESPGGTIVLRPTVETKKDLVWALGGRGMPAVRKLDTQIISAEKQQQQ
jgi:hypothetical protein